VTLISLDRIERRFGDVVVLTGASLRVDERDRIGVVGGNGTGKTTLIRILAGVDQQDRGARLPRKDLRIAYAEQIPRLEPGTTVHEFVLRGTGEFQALERRVQELERELAEHPGDARLLEDYGHVQGAFEAGGGYDRRHLCEKVLSGLGFREDEWQKDVTVLSGGEKSRLVLASLMTAPADLLILDEPTNHLDVEGIEFVEGHVQRWNGAVVIVSHDRHFLDATALHIVEVEDGTAQRFKGNWSAYRSQRDLQLLAEARAFKNQQEFIDKEMDFIRRNMAGRNHAQAKGRLKKLQRLHVLEAPRREGRGMHLRFGAGRGQAGQTMLEAEDLRVALPDGRVLLDGVSFKLLHGETVGLVGRNGSGKSTLMRAIAGLWPIQRGKLRLAHGVRIGYFSQQVTDLPQAMTVLEAMRQMAPEATEQELRDHLALFLLVGDQVDATVATLSGGEKQRLSLARLTRSGYDLLCLDEPTNHLDIQGREVLERALRDYGGAVLLITHDRQLLETATDRVLHVEGGRLRSFDGGLAQCLTALAEERQAERARAADERTRQRTAAAAGSGETRGAPSGKIRNPLMFERLEQDIMRIEAEIQQIQDDMTKAENYLDAARMKALQAREASLRSELAANYERWENWT
jgi:ATP-binding cassette subfamily F protein 3